MSSLLPDSAKYDLTVQLRACQSRSRRNGKVARLPEGLRQQVNRMIDDGLPYKVIIQKLGQAGKHLNEDNLSNWRLGGYQDYLKAQALQDRARTQTEAAADLVREAECADPAKLQQVCTQIGLLHYLETLAEHGDQIARDSLRKTPAKFITLINACSNMSNANIAIERHKWKTPPPCSAPLPAQGSDGVPPGDRPAVPCVHPPL